MNIEDVKVGMRVRYTWKEYTPFGKIGTVIKIDNHNIAIDFGELFQNSTTFLGTKESPWWTSASNLELAEVKEDEHGNYW